MPSQPPKWIKPQLTRLAEEAPQGADWLHEIKYDGYRMHARIDGGKIQLLTRTGLDWSHRYKRTIEALRSLRVKSAYIDGELCALNATACQCSANYRRQWTKAERISSCSSPSIFFF
jgi:ATP-dependent DNA ligase